MNIAKRVLGFAGWLLVIAVCVVAYDIASLSRRDSELVNAATAIVNKGEDISKAEAKLKLLKGTEVELKPNSVVARRLYKKGILFKWLTYEEITIEFQNNIAKRSTNHQYQPAAL